MLRLKKTAISKSVYVTLRENTRLLTPTFLQAMSLAVCLHLFAFLLFHVQPFRIKLTHTQYPPVQVNIEIALPDSAIFADLKKNKPHHTPISEPRWHEPVIPNLSLNPPNHLEIFPTEDRLPMSPFLIDRDTELLELWVNLEPATPSIEQAPQLSIFGPLSQRSVVVDTFPKSVQPTQNNRSKKLLYSVKVDDASGKIFWYASLSDQTERKAELILENLKFEPLRTGFVTDGKIELHLSGGKK